MAMRLKTLITKFLSWCEVVRKPATTANYRWLLLKFLRRVKNKQINKLLPADLEQHGKTWHEVQAVQRLFQWAKDSIRVVKENIFAKVKRPPLGMRTRILPPRELTKFLRKTSRPFRDFMIAMRESIARPQEIRALKWSMLATDDPHMTLAEALPAGWAKFVTYEFKSRERCSNPNKPRIVRVNRRLGRLLLRLLAKDPPRDGFVFGNRFGKQWTGNAVRCRMRRLRARFPELAGLGGGENVVAYSLRHSSATIATAKGVRDKELSELMGHHSTDMVERYQHLQDDHLRMAMERIEDLPGRQQKREERRKARSQEKRKKRRRGRGGRGGNKAA